MLLIEELYIKALKVGRERKNAKSYVNKLSQGVYARNRKINAIYESLMCEVLKLHKIFHDYRRCLS